MNYRDKIMGVMSDYVIHPPSASRLCFLELKRSKDLDYIIDVVLAAVASDAADNKPLMTTCRKIGDRLMRTSHPDNKWTTTKVVKMGIHMVDILVLAKVVKIEKYRVRDNDANLCWFIKIIDEEYFNDYITEVRQEYRLDNGPTPWTQPYMYLNDTWVEMVKGIHMHGIEDEYTMDKMPQVYNALNRLNETTWKINKEVYDLIKRGMDGSNIFVPQEITEKERTKAKKIINQTERTALWLAEIQFKQLIDKGYEEDLAAKYAKENAETYRKKNIFDSLGIISKWSKRENLNYAMKVAERYMDTEINFLYWTDSRGRIYAKQLFLNPQMDDYAKSLLMFANPKQISTYDFYIHMANCAGIDKVTFEDRINWVKKNEDNIYMVGKDPWSKESIEWLMSIELHREKKTRMQFIVACMWYVKLHDYILEHGSDDGFLLPLSVGYDATNSGLQVLSILGRDDFVAPHVNITHTDEPGDIYQYIGGYVAAEISKLEEDHPIRVLDQFPPTDKMWRKICKRNVMTKPYSATRFGMGEQQWEDRKTYGSDITDELTPGQCNKLGGIVYDVCASRLPKAEALMATFKSACPKDGSPMIMWKLPNGFTAYQHKEKRRLSTIKGTIGDTDVKLNVWMPTGNTNRGKHVSAISPNIVHSLDAWLLTTVVNNMPYEANLHFIHDQFGSDSCHGADIQDYARMGYRTISSRVVLEAILYQVAGKSVELPSPGKWKVEELEEATYIVC